jgi:predicted enzyme related to lactoylglutathione lyase
MAKVIGITGVFFKAKDAPALRAWYQRHLGIDLEAEGATVFTAAADDPEAIARKTAWSIVPAQGTHFLPSATGFMIMYRVDDLRALVATLTEDGCTIERSAQSEHGTFAWILDPEGNCVELWQPVIGQ